MPPPMPPREVRGCCSTCTRESVFYDYCVLSMISSKHDKKECLVYQELADWPGRVTVALVQVESYETLSDISQPLVCD